MRKQEYIFQCQQRELAMILLQTWGPGPAVQNSFIHEAN